MKPIVFVSCFFFGVTAAVAGPLGSGGVRSIASNGKINGDASWIVKCNQGGSGVIRRRGDTWADDTGNTYSDRLWSLSLEDFAKVMCE